MKIMFEQTKEDWIHFNLFHIKNSERIKRQIIKNQIYSSLVLIIVGVLLGAYNWINTGSFDLGVFIWFLFCGILMFFFYKRYAAWKVAKRLRKSVNKEDDMKMFTQTEFDFSDEGIIEKTPYNETKMTWHAIHSLKEDEAYFYLYLDSVRAFPIPKRACEDQEGFRTLIKKSMTR